MEVYVKKLDAEGKEVFEVVDTNTLDVREHPEYKKVLDEQVKTRKKLAEVKTKLTDDGGSGEPPKQDVPADAPKADAPHIPTVDEILAEMQKRQDIARAAQVQAETEVANRVKAAAEKHKLPNEALPLLNQARDPEAMAEAIAKGALQFATNPAGGDDLQSQLADILAKVDERLEGKKASK